MHREMFCVAALCSVLLAERLRIHWPAPSFLLFWLFEVIDWISGAVICVDTISMLSTPSAQLVRAHTESHSGDVCREWCLDCAMSCRDLQSLLRLPDSSFSRLTQEKSGCAGILNVYQAGTEHCETRETRHMARLPDNSGRKRASLLMLYPILNKEC